jgi:anti-sigma regulatory factor (Ser/Thr protein kinase)
VLRQHRGKTMSELADLLLESMHAFARGAPQEDDVTIVLIQREMPRPAAVSSFERSLDSLEAIFGFIGASLASHGIDSSLRPPVEFAVEELFTNVVKYGKASRAEVRLGLTRIPGGVEATLIDDDSDPFDITQVPDANVDLPIEQREPGGLGIHLVRRMVDSIEYEYRAELRQTRITFRKTLKGPSGPGGAAKKGGGHVHD